MESPTDDDLRLPGRQLFPRANRSGESRFFVPTLGLRRRAVKVYYVVGWDDHYEDRITRRMAHLKFLKQSVNLQDDNLILLLAKPDGHALYGVWRLMLSLAGRCENRGVFALKGGAPYDESTLAARIRAPIELLKHALSALLEIRWIACASSVAKAITLARTKGKSARITEPNRTEPEPEREYKTEPKGESRDGLRCAGAEAVRSGNNGHDPEYEAAVKVMFLAFADRRLLAKIINNRVGLDACREVLNEFLESGGPTRSSQSAYLTGMFVNRGHFKRRAK